MAKVNKHTRAGKAGKLISCPHCKNEFNVKHFAWSSLKCVKCKKYVDKYDWNIVKPK